jgi:stress-induced morphogen
MTLRKFIRDVLPSEKVVTLKEEKSSPMPMSPEKIRTLLEDHFLEAQIHLEDLAGDQDQFSLHIVSTKFQGKSRVARHQMVYQALTGKMGGELHALSITALTPDENDAN